MPDNELIAASSFEAESNLSLSLEPTVITPDYFIQHYPEFLRRYIAKGSPSQDTMQSYCIRINRFIAWCVEHKRHPLSMSDYQMHIYRDYLVQKSYAADTIQSKLTAIKAFYHTALKLGLIKENPCADIEAPYSNVANQLIHAYRPDQMKEVCDIFMEEADPFLKWRNTAILYLMGVEGLRNVEVHRACLEDIDWDQGIINVRGKGSKGRMDPVFPCVETMEVLRNYVEAIDPNKKIKKDGMLTPFILSDSNNNEFGRISRNGIRYIMNKALVAADLKYPGLSCHVFRHSCGTNLYAETKDLRLVQDTLRHRDPKVTARYAHLAGRLEHRSTSVIAKSMLQSDKNNHT